MKNERLLPLFALTFASVVFVAGLLLQKTVFYTPLQIPLTQVQLSTADVSVTNNASASDELVNINTATSEQLQTLPGIGPNLAEKIVAYRRANGPFRSVAELINVSGIGENKLNAIWNLVTTGG